ncbi:NUDIX domain-containing protein [Streptomyces antimycoticus]
MFHRSTLTADMRDEQIADFMHEFGVSEPTATMATDLFLTIGTSTSEDQVESEFQQAIVQSHTRDESWATEFLHAVIDKRGFRATYQHAIATGQDPAAELAREHLLPAVAAAELVALLATGTTQITVDVVCLRGDNVLLIERGWPPYQGRLALPGGYMEPCEYPHVAAARELLEETGVKVSADELVLVDVFARPDRDPRGRFVSVAYVITVGADTTARAGDDAAAVQWVPLDAIGDLAFDHGEIVHAAWQQQLAAHPSGHTGPAVPTSLAEALAQSAAAAEDDAAERAAAAAFSIDRSENFLRDPARWRGYEDGEASFHLAPGIALHYHGAEDERGRRGHHFTLLTSESDTPVTVTGVAQIRHHLAALAAGLPVTTTGKDTAAPADDIPRLHTAP